VNEQAKDLLDSALVLLYVFAAGWLAGTVVSAALTQILMLLPLAAIKNPALAGRLELGLEVGSFSLAAAVKYMAGGFMYRLLKRGDWRRAGFLAWSFFVILSVAMAPGLVRSIWLYWRSAVGLAAALYGAHWALENEFSPGVQGLREMLVGILGG
jgi:hypothetical protein